MFQHGEELKSLPKRLLVFNHNRIKKKKGGAVSFLLEISNGQEDGIGVSTRRFALGRCLLRFYRLHQKLPAVSRCSFGSECDDSWSEHGRSVEGPSINGVRDFTDLGSSSSGSKE